MDTNKECISLEAVDNQANKALIPQAKELKFIVPWGHVAGKAWGDPCSYPILCLHGIQDNAGTFDLLIPQLPRTFYYVCIDLPGHGYSSPFPEGISLDFTDYVLMLVRVMNNLNWETCYVMGHSLGGQLAVYLCGLWPERVKKLILIDAVVPAALETKQFLSRHKHLLDHIFNSEEKFSTNNIPNYTYDEALTRIISNRRSELSLEGGKSLITRSLFKNDLGGYRFTTDQRLKVGLWSGLNETQQQQILDNVKCPVLAVLTDIPKLAQIWRSAKLALQFFSSKPNFTRVDVEGNHDVHLNNPERIAPIVSKFLTTWKSSL
ncbi:hypothetical protein L9F63_005369 [Diploptera punctata]|uniref:AB hydrolase-1 domain-containing protein n=1 Tax=Diploptera punctata TaxID=6984 RepID=A0AAD8E6B2_DIPPU|nr:hypothetical protein L9F63_005369 [Diploptera punctata]